MRHDSDPRHAAPPPLDMAEVLALRPERGVIRLHEQRVVVLSAAAMGLLRKALIDTLGLETARRVFLRFGYADGYDDALALRDRARWATPLDGLRAGIALHGLEGIVRPEIVVLDHDAASGRFTAEIVWHDSYVAEQHLYHYGRSQAPMCWSLAGYASGYVSACLGQEIYFREVRCVSRGDATCAAIGRDAASWDGSDSLEALRLDFQGADLGRQVERLRIAAHQQLHDLGRREQQLSARERELDVLRERVAEHATAARFVARSAAMREVLELAGRVAPLDTTVLVHGESGTGKEFVVRLIHDQSRRAGGPFVSINCAALTDTLLESELFGHVRGAFTGAVRDKAGLFEIASRGTLFLDEVGEAAPTVQAKLLRALQEREIRRVGAASHIRVDARVVAATNRDLRAAVASGSFREDLYFRLAGFVIPLPPLRERREDIPPLVYDLVRRSAAHVGKDVTTVSPEAMAALMHHDWPGNVRELEHAIERAVIVTHGRTVRAHHLPPEIARTPPDPVADTLDLNEQERAMIARALACFGGNRRQAAAALRIGTVTLWRKMKRYGLAAPRRRRARAEPSM